MEDKEIERVWIIDKIQSTSEKTVYNWFYILKNK
jgi:hypothetical protein